MTEEITSAQNPNFKKWVNLLTNIGMKKFQQGLVSGHKILHEVVQHSQERVEAIIYTQKHDIAPHLMPFKKYCLAPALFKELDLFGTHSPLLILNLPQLPTWDHRLSPKGIEILCPLGDPANLGALIRAAMAFDVDNIVLLKESANPFLPKVTRASAGANLIAPLQFGPSLDKLNEVAEISALDLSGDSIFTYRWPQNTRLLLGEEGPGLNSHIEHQKITIPINPKVDSLNAVSAASIAIYAYRQQHKKL